jgi:hypothetical protein
VKNASFEIVLCPGKSMFVEKFSVVDKRHGIYYEKLKNKLGLL